MSDPSAPSQSPSASDPEQPDNVTPFPERKPEHEVAYEYLRPAIAAQHDPQLLHALDRMHEAIRELEDMLSLERMRGDSLYETGVVLRDRAEAAETVLLAVDTELRERGDGRVSEAIRSQMRGVIGEPLRGGDQMPDEKDQPSTEKETTTREDTTREETTKESPAPQQGEE